MAIQAGSRGRGRSRRSASSSASKPSTATITSSSSAAVPEPGKEDRQPNMSAIARGKQKEKVEDDDEGEEDEADQEIPQESDDSSDDSDAPGIDLDKIRKRMHHALRHLSTAAKRARQFEVQRLVKRIKSTTTAEDKVSLEAQLLSLKSIDLHNVAATSLLGKLGKAKLLPRGTISHQFRTSEAQSQEKGIDVYPLLAGVWAEEGFRKIWMDLKSAAVDPTSEMEKVKAKVLSSKTLADEVAKMVDTLGRLAGRVRPATGVDKEKETSSVQGGDKMRRESMEHQQDEDMERVWSGSEDDVDDEEIGSISGTDSEEGDDLDEETIQAQVAALGDLSKWDALVAAGSSNEGSSAEEDEGDYQGADAGADGKAHTSKRKRSTSPQGANFSKKAAKASGEAPPSSEEDETDASSFDSDDDDDDDEEEDDSSTTSSSHFLPSLSHGFLAHSRRNRDDDFSGDESEGSIEENPEDKASKAKGVKSSKERKNRMGQRARKALWEKKFGRNANHLKLQEKDHKKSRGVAGVADGEDSGRASSGYQPVRRGRNGKPLPIFEKPEQVDSGWKKFPVKADPPRPSPSSSKPADRKKGVKSSTTPQSHHQPQERYPRSHSSTTTTTTRTNPPPVRFQTQRPIGNGGQTGEQDMHPSWIAKQKEKEKLDLIARSLSGGGGGGGGGKKITFD